MEKQKILNIISTRSLGFMEEGGGEDSIYLSGRKLFVMISVISSFGREA